MKIIPPYINTVYHTTQYSLYILKKFVTNKLIPKLWHAVSA